MNFNSILPLSGSIMVCLPFIGLSCSNSPEKPTDKPNILVLFVDDLGYNDVGFRNEMFSTPNIDNLVKTGTVFDQAYVPSPTCSPSRAGLYTGQHPARLEFFRHISGDTDGEYNLWEGDTSLLFSRNYLPLETITYAEVAKNNGYNTFFAGKWHLGSDQYGPLNQGWDEAISKTGAGMPRNYYQPYFDGKGFWNDIKDNQYLTDFYTDKVLDYINNYDSDKPFLLQFSFHNVHVPNIGRKDFLQMYKDKGFEGDRIEFGAQVSAVDEAVGRVLSALEEKGKANNTIVFFTSDQGSFFPNLPLRGTKAVGTTLYEGGQKVPFIVKWPGKIKGGEKNQTYVQTTDIFPTICELTGDNPDNYEGLEGNSLLGVLTQKKQLDREAIFAFRSYDAQYASVIAKDDWKLIAYRDDRYELYKVDEDIAEEEDLSEKYPEKVGELKGLLQDWLLKTGVNLTEY